MNIIFLLIGMVIVIYLMAINHKLYHLNRKVGQIMPALTKLAEYVTQIDAETTRIAELIETLLAKEGVTVEQLQDALTPVVDNLKAVGNNPPPPEE